MVLRSAIDDGAQFVMRGNSSATAAALIDAISRQNEREPAKRVVSLYYSAVDPGLTNEQCSFWHFPFDAQANIRLGALTQVLQQDRGVRSVHLIRLDYSFGQALLNEARRQLSELCPGVHVVAGEVHPMGHVTDFLPCAARIRCVVHRRRCHTQLRQRPHLVGEGCKEHWIPGQVLYLLRQRSMRTSSNWRGGRRPLDCCRMTRPAVPPDDIASQGK